MCINSPGREVLRISSDADDRIEAKIQNPKKYLWFTKNSKKIPGPKLKFKFKFIYSHLFNYCNTTTIRKKRSKNRANYTLNQT